MNAQGQSLFVELIPIFADKHVRLLYDEGRPIDLVEALLYVSSEWWGLTNRQVVFLALRLERLNAAIVAFHRQQALAAQETRRAATPQSRPVGTRKARHKRTSKGGRR